MSTEFTREDRYIVFKLSDVERYLTDADRAHLAMMKNEIDAGRDCANKPPFKGLIVESDWPEYERTWRAIAARATGAEQPSSHAFDDSATIAGLESAVIHLSACLDSFRALLVEVNDVCGRDGHGGHLEDGESEIIDKVRAALAMTDASPQETKEICK
jgi:hypothetical protein